MNNSITSLSVSATQHSLSTSPQQYSNALCSESIVSMNTVIDCESKLIHEDHSYFTLQYDSQLLQWFKKSPENWTCSFGGASTIFGWVSFFITSFSFSI